MTSESGLIMEIWELVRDSLPTARRAETALGILRAFEDFGFERKDVADIVEEDNYLSKAFRELYDEDVEDELDFEE